MDLFDRATQCLLTRDLDEKMSLSEETASLWQEGNLALDCGKIVQHCEHPGKLEKPRIVQPHQVSRRKLTNPKGQAAMIHAMAHIEWTAVNLSWDNILSFPHMPRQYYSDWVQTAAEETRHFRALRACLQEMDLDYGAFDVHDQLWQMAWKTRHNLLARMGVVHRIMEARALDVVPGIAKKFDALGKKNVVCALNTIANEEIGHVRSSTHWFSYRCKEEGKDPEKEFFDLVRIYFQGKLRGPFNHQARKNAGFSERELVMLEKGVPSV